jgi:hypothetical protein
MSYTSKYFCYLVFTLLAYTGIAQDTISKFQGDSLYREDQFYLGITYNLLTSLPSGVHPEGLSGGFYFGFLRDMPINKKRNLAIAIGAGMSFDQYSQNLFIDKDPNGETTFTILDNVDFESNRFKTAIVEIPFELRWRSSTPTTYQFWRAYAGLRVGYAFWHKASFKGSTGTISHSDISEFDKLSLGTTLSLGYNKFNFFLYYSINPFFKDEAKTNDGQKVNFRTIKLGLIFYIL